VGVLDTEDILPRAVHMVSGHAQPKLNQDTLQIPWDTARTGCGEGFSSLHPAGAQFLHADGSVRFVAETIGQNWSNLSGDIYGTIRDSRDRPNGVYQRLMTRDDKLVVNEF